uniref:Uncharacterized protein n=1 Tax=Myotis myotis TaxID=51298 RepID=A0A7J7Y005_MYOMY|nr:hypothetical protein mMyoMyo1_011483 [Myotis myotis]
MISLVRHCLPITSFPWALGETLNREDMRSGFRGKSCSPAVAIKGHFSKYHHLKYWQFCCNTDYATPILVIESETLGRAQETKFEIKSPSGSYEEPIFEIRAEHDSPLRTFYRYPLFVLAPL